MTKRRSTIPKVVIPSYGMPFPRLRSTRPYDHRKVRAARLAYLRAYPLCQRCSRLAMQVHHRTPINQGGHPFDFGNLESLCLDCHYRAHGKRGRPLMPPDNPPKGP